MKHYVHFNPVLIILFLFRMFIFTESIHAASNNSIQPDWVDNWRNIYSDEIYIAQLGKAFGKKNDSEAKNIAANNVAQYIQTTIQSQTQSQSRFSTQSTEKGTLSTFIEKNISQDITLSVDLAVTSFEFTEPWYNKKEKVWYCVAYVQREKVWLQYQPKIQAVRDRLFAFYSSAEESEEPLYRMLIYMQARNYETDFFKAYSFAQILSAPLTQKYYQKDAVEISKTAAKNLEEKNKCTFVVRVNNDTQDIVYQKIKDELSKEGFAVKNDSETALYTVDVILNYGDNPSGNLHVLHPFVELSITGKTTSIFSYAKQASSISGLNEQVVKSKATRAIAEEIGNTFILEFNEKLNITTNNNLVKLMGLN